MLYKVVLTFKFVDETLGHVCERSSENYEAVIKWFQEISIPSPQGVFEFNPLLPPPPTHLSRNPTWLFSHGNFF